MTALSCAHCKYVSVTVLPRRERIDPRVNNDRNPFLFSVPERTKSRGPEAGIFRLQKMIKMYDFEASSATTRYLSFFSKLVFLRSLIDEKIVFIPIQ